MDVASLQPLTGLPAFEDWPVAEYSAFMEAHNSRVTAAWVCFRRRGSSARADGCCGCFWSWLQRTHSPEWIHVEMLFRCDAAALVAHGASHYEACTVDLADADRPGSGSVRFVERDPRSERTYPDELWRCFQLRGFSETELLGLFFYCHRQVSKPINAVGLYWNFLPGSSALTMTQEDGPCHAERPAYFCSELMTCALCWVRPQLRGELPPASRATPHDLYDYFVLRCRCVESISFADPATRARL